MPRLNTVIISISSCIMFLSNLFVDATPVLSYYGGGGGGDGERYPSHMNPPHLGNPTFRSASGNNRRANSMNHNSMFSPLASGLGHTSMQADVPSSSVYSGLGPLAQGVNNILGENVGGRRHRRQVATFDGYDAHSTNAVQQNPYHFGYYGQPSQQQQHQTSHYNNFQELYSAHHPSAAPSGSPPIPIRRLPPVPEALAPPLPLAVNPAYALRGHASFAANPRPASYEDKPEESPPSANTDTNVGDVTGRAEQPQERIVGFDGQELPPLEQSAEPEIRPTSRQQQSSVQGSTDSNNSRSSRRSLQPSDLALLREASANNGNALLHRGHFLRRSTEIWTGLNLDYDEEEATREAAERSLMDHVIQKNAPQGDEPKADIIRLADIKDEKEKHRAGNACAFCLEQFTGDDDEFLVRHQKCKHVHHLECTQKWLKEHRDCPNCRQLTRVSDTDLKKFGLIDNSS